MKNTGCMLHAANMINNMILRLHLLHGVLILILCCLPHSHGYAPTNARLEKAYTALQALKRTITCDPKGITSNWCGPHVCSYTGVFCAPAPDNPHELTVAGVDLNDGELCGTLPEELGLLSDLALFHINSNQFKGGIPKSFGCLKLLYELDVSNNLLDGPFPSVVLEPPSLRFLDIRYNRFCGEVPSRLFDLKLDALFINHNHLTLNLPDNMGNSPVSVLVIANNIIKGCFPRSLFNMNRTLNELIIMNSGLTSCLPPELGGLSQLTVFDVSFNNLVGHLPESIGQMKKLEQLDVAHNKLSGAIPATICQLPHLQNFTYSYNYFCTEPEVCLKNVKKVDDRNNCIPFRPKQRPSEECHAFLSQKPVICDCRGCIVQSPPSPPPASPPPPHHY